MTQIEQIKAEIERLKAEAFTKINHDTKRSMVTDVASSQRIAICEQLLDFITSLPAEQPSEELKKAAEEYASMSQIAYKGIHCTYVDDQHAFIAGAQWQKEQMLKGFCYETTVYRDEEGDGINTPIESWLAIENNEIMNLPDIGLKDGNKVKVIIVKEDEQ